MITWRGWGVAVFYLLLFWMIAGIVAGVAAGIYQPDRVKASLDVQWGLTGMFVLHAASVYALCRYRKNHPLRVADAATGQTVSVPHVDEFMYLRMDVWPYILLGIAGILAIVTAVGYPLFLN